MLAGSLTDALELADASVRQLIDPLDRVTSQSSDDLDRNLFCVLGLPIDAVGIDDAVKKIRVAAQRGARLLLSTPNLNFLVASRFDRVLLDSVLASDLCPPDGMPLIWVARLLGLPIPERVGGSDIFIALQRQLEPSVSVCFFGGAPGIARKACEHLNLNAHGLVGVGAVDPGSGSVADLSQEPILQAVNGSGADFLVVALGAQKGQAWLLQNADRITIPVRAHLGAVINFEAGVIRRAPAVLQRLGLEWVWRIKEEPHLWRRYWTDGLVFLKLLIGNVIPLVVWRFLHRGIARIYPAPLRMNFAEQNGCAILSMRGDATEEHATSAAEFLKKSSKHENVTLTIDLSHVRYIDQRFLGLLLMIRKTIVRQRGRVLCVGASPALRRLIRFNCCEYLLD